MRTDTNGSPGSSRFDLAQRTYLPACKLDYGAILSMAACTDSSENGLVTHIYG